MKFTGTTLGVAALSLGAVVALAACSSNTSTSSAAPTAGHSGHWAAAQSATDGGGTDALIAAAKAEGKINVIALPRDWANYGTIIDGFSAKYGIKVNSINPDASSGDEINALQNSTGQDTAPDVVDVGNSYALSGAQTGLYAPYKVATWGDIPDSQKDSGGLWASDYGGYISIGCDAAKITNCPKSFKDLNNPAFKGMVALNGDPTTANAAFNAVWAASLTNGGSATDIQPGLDYFKTLNSAGIFNKTKANQATIQKGATPISIDWDYLNAGYATDATKAAGVNWQVNVPTDGLVSGYYAQAINRQAPHPAAARLWEEFLYSQTTDGGQNLWLQGLARPIALQAMIKNGSVDQTALAKLPSVTDSTSFNPTQDQIVAAKKTVSSGWATAVQ